jgi:hypothetical protein
MSGRTSKIVTRSVVVAAAATVAAMLGAGIAAADVAVDNTLYWNGDFPIIGNLDPISTETVTSLPSPVTHGVESSSFPVSVTVDAPSLATTGLEDVGAASVEGTATVVVVADGVSQTVNLTIPSTPTPADGDDLVFTATGTATISALPGAGSFPVTVQSASTTLDPKDSDGNDTILGTFAVDLSRDSSGPSSNPTNNPTLGTIVVN